ncbi:hypothetical protein BDV18DRAFT_160846 [Aspergillus unguis]
MTTRREREAEDAYERENDYSGHVTSEWQGNSYAHEAGGRGFRGGIPVQADDAAFDDPMQPPFSNTDQQLAQDEDEAIDSSNILGSTKKGRTTRRAKPRATGYNEGPTEDELPDEAFETGQSSVGRGF